MCVKYAKKARLQMSEGFMAYKVVKSYDGNSFESFLPIVSRARQSYFLDKRFCILNRGTKKFYKLNEIAFSNLDTTPGLYCFKSLSGARNFAIKYLCHATIIKVWVPFGSRFVKTYIGYNSVDFHTINAEEIIPVEVVMKI